MKRNIAFFLGLLLFALVWLLPTPAGMSPSAQHVAATVTLMAAWWIGEALPLAATALIPLAVFPLLGVSNASKVAQAYADHLVFLFLGGFFIAASIQKWGLHRRIALFVLSVVGTSPARIVLGFMLATAFLSMWMSNTATTMMMFPIAVAVVRQRIGSLPSTTSAEERSYLESRFGLVVMLAVAYSASIGGTGTLIGTPPNVILAGQYGKLFPNAPPITFAGWMLVALPVVVVSLAVCWVYLVYVTAPSRMRKALQSLGGEDVVRGELSELGPMTPPEKRVLAVFVLTALLWVFRADMDFGALHLPGWGRLLPEPKFVKDSTVAMAMGLLLFALPAGRPKGEHLLDWETARTIPWGILILFGGGFAIAEGIESSGLSTWIGAGLGRAASVPPFILVTLCCVVVVLLTEVTSNTAVAAMFVPILGALAKQLSVPPLLFMIPVTMAASFAFVLPVATPPNAIVMGSGWVTIPQMARAGIVLDIVGVVILVAVTFTLGPLLM